MDGLFQMTVKARDLQQGTIVTSPHRLNHHTINSEPCHSCDEPPRWVCLHANPGRGPTEGRICAFFERLRNGKLCTECRSGAGSNWDPDDEFPIL